MGLGIPLSLFIKIKTRKTEFHMDHIFYEPSMLNDNLCYQKSLIKIICTLLLLFLILACLLSTQFLNFGSVIESSINNKVQSYIKLSVWNNFHLLETAFQEKRWFVLRLWMKNWFGLFSICRLGEGTQCDLGFGFIKQVRWETDNKIKMLACDCTNSLKVHHALLIECLVH